MSIADQLAELARLRSEGSLTEVEFQAAKEKLLAEQNVGIPVQDSAPPAEPVVRVAKASVGQRVASQWREGGRSLKFRLGAYVVVTLLVSGGAIAYASSDVRLQTPGVDADVEEKFEALASRNADERERKEQEELEAAARFQGYLDCKRALQPFMGALAQLDSRLAVGLSFQEYGTQVGTIRVKYDAVPFGRLDFKCINRVGIPAESALNAYVEAYNTWNDCIGDFGCDLDLIEPGLQQEWSKATRELGEARRGLNQLRYA